MSAKYPHRATTYTPDLHPTWTRLRCTCGLYWPNVSLDHALLEHYKHVTEIHAAEVADLTEHLSKSLRATDTEGGFKDEYAIEVEWVDHVDAGAEEPTSVFGWSDLEGAERHLESTRMRREIARTRILVRRAAYTEAQPYQDWVTTTEDERVEIWQRMLADMQGEKTDG